MQQPSSPGIGPAHIMKPPEISRQHVLDLIGTMLAERHRLPRSEASVSVRRYGGGDGDAETPAIIAFVRLNAWRPDVLLRSPQIERQLRQAVHRASGIRIGYVFWRVSSSVATPADLTERVPVRAAAPRVAHLQQAAQQAGALPPADAPVTDWTDLAEDLPNEN